MGLAISRSIAEAHGGRLSAGPNKPRGAVFRLTLPVKETSWRGLEESRPLDRHGRVAGRLHREGEPTYT